MICGCKGGTRDQHQVVRDGPGLGEGGRTGQDRAAASARTAPRIFRSMQHLRDDAGKDRMRCRDVAVEEMG